MGTVGGKTMARFVEQIFETPSGNVRGIVNVFMYVNGKEKRIGHATLLTEGGADTSLEIPRKLALDDIKALTILLNEFASRVKSLSI